MIKDDLSRRAKIYQYLTNDKLYSSGYKRKSEDNISTIDVILFPFLKCPQQFTIIRDTYIRAFYNAYIKPPAEREIQYCSNNLYYSILVAILDILLRCPNTQYVIVNDLKAGEKNKIKLLMNPILESEESFSILKNNINNSDDFFNITLRTSDEKRGPNPEFLSAFEWTDFLRENYPDIVGKYMVHSDSDYVDYMFQLTQHFGLVHHFLDSYKCVLENHSTILDKLKAEEEGEGGEEGEEGEGEQQQQQQQQPQPSPSSLLPPPLPRPTPRGAVGTVRVDDQRFGRMALSDNEYSYEDVEDESERENEIERNMIKDKRKMIQNLRKRNSSQNNNLWGGGANGRFGIKTHKSTKRQLFTDMTTSSDHNNRHSLLKRARKNLDGEEDEQEVEPVVKKKKHLELFKHRK